MPAALFAELNASFREAETTSGGCLERTCRIDGFLLRLRFAGPALIPYLLPALEHLEIAGEGLSPDLTVCLWTGAAKETGDPARRIPAGRINARGDIPGFDDETVCGAFFADAGALSLLDRSRNLALFWAGDETRLPVHEMAAPLKAILHWGLRDRGWFMIHSAAMGTPDGVVLMTGKTGSGKSTAALACFSAGLGYVSDDRCLFSVKEGPRVFCVYSSAKLFPRQISRFPDLLPSVSNPKGPDSEKSLVFLSRHAPERVLSRAPVPVRAILLTSFSGRRETVAEPSAPGPVLREMAASSMIYQPGWGQPELDALAAAVHVLPCYRISLGADLSGIAPVVSRVLRDHGSEFFAGRKTGPVR